MLKIISPTKKGIRQRDAWGHGWFRASRGTESHKGADFICEPGQNVYAPISGKVIREARPYETGDYSGLVITNGYFSIKMFYFKPLPSLVSTGKRVEMGDIIGIAQDISKRTSPKTGKPYTGMIPHLHVEVRINPAFLQSNEGVLINPEILL